MSGRTLSQMSPRERIEAALSREPCDQVPFTPLLDGYFQTSLPGGADRNPADVQFELTGHVVSRIGVLRLNTPLWLASIHLRDLASGIEERFSRDGDDLIHTVETPVGSLTWRLRFTEESPMIPWVIENRIRSVEDVKTFQYLIEHTEVDLTTSYLEGQREHVGDRGVVTVLGPTSPLQQMNNFDMGVERVTYMLADHPDEMIEMLDTFHAKQLEMWRRMAELRAEVFFIHDNLSSTTTSRAMYRRYDRRYVNEYADVLHRAGKKLITHWCGRLKGFAADLAEARQDGISDVAPPPTGDTDILEARTTWARQFVVMGGIDANLFARGTTGEMEAYVEDLLRRMEPDRRGFILGSGDAVPLGTPTENLIAAARTAARFSVE